jgi:hypothetical protein
MINESAFTGAFCVYNPRMTINFSIEKHPSRSNSFELKRIKICVLFAKSAFVVQCDTQTVQFSQYCKIYPRNWVQYLNDKSRICTLPYKTIQVY